MGRNPVKVAIRTRPTSNFAKEELFIDSDTNTIEVRQNLHEGDSYLNNRNGNFNFNYHHVLHNSSQDTIYETGPSDIVQGVCDGVNGCIMSYGQTGAGKTFTMIGDTKNYVHRGVAPRSISHIFREVEARTETSFIISCTYVELYNEKIFDLLADLSKPEKKKDFTIVESKTGKGIHIRGLNEVRVKTEQEALNLLYSGELGRTTATHKLNPASNRSHSIFTVYIQQRAKTGVSERVVTSKLNLVDLAGSERLKKTMGDDFDGGVGLDATIKKESMHINQSLTYLEQCVVALSRRTVAAYVPYRQCRLTNVLKDSIGGNCNTMMISCIWGESSQLEETISTLRLASRMMRVQNETKSVEILDPEQMVKKQEKIIRELKQELLMHDALAERTEQMVYDQYTPEQAAEVRKMVEKYIKANVDEEDDMISFKSVRQMREISKQFKNVVLEMQIDLKNAQVNHTQQIAEIQSRSNSNPLIQANVDQNGQSNGFEFETVGDMDRTKGFTLGKADNNAKPVVENKFTGGMGSGVDQGSSEVNEIPNTPNATGAGEFMMTTTSNFNDTTDTVDSMTVDVNDREKSYTAYKKGPGKEKSKLLLEIKSKLKDSKLKAKTNSASINDIKREIDYLEQKIEEKRQSKIGFDEDTVDEDEFKLIKREKEVKKLYRDAYEQLTLLKGDIRYLEEEAEKIRFDLVENFDEWHMQTRRLQMTGGTADLGDDEDKLDDQEMFDKMEVEKIMNEDPDALAFFQAQKTRIANKTQNSVTLRQMHKNKRNR